MSTLSAVLPGASETQSWHTFFSPFHPVFSLAESFEGVLQRCQRAKDKQRVPHNRLWSCFAVRLLEHEDGIGN